MLYHDSYSFWGTKWLGYNILAIFPSLLFKIDTNILFVCQLFCFIEERLIWMIAFTSVCFIFKAACYGQVKVKEWKTKQRDNMSVSEVTVKSNAWLVKLPSGLLDSVEKNMAGSWFSKCFYLYCRRTRVSILYKSAIRVTPCCAEWYLLKIARNRSTSLNNFILLEVYTHKLLK